MSNQVFPSFPGLNWDIVRRPRWNTLVRQTASGREFRTARYSYPIWEYKLSYSVLRARPSLTEMQTLAGFFNQHNGSADSWRYEDPDDNSVVGQLFGQGNGSTRVFQLVRSFGGFTEPVFELNGAPQIFINGALRTVGTHYTIDSLGVVTFVTAPGAGLPITWTGSYWWRCRFMQDGVEFNQFMRQLWDLRSLEFTTVKP